MYYFKFIKDRSSVCSPGRISDDTHSLFCKRNKLFKEVLEPAQLPK